MINIVAYFVKCHDGDNIAAEDLLGTGYEQYIY